MNRRDNMLAILNHQPHDHVGDFKTDVCSTGGNLESFENGPAGGGLDGFGCKWLPSESALGQGVPAAGHVALENILDWKKTLKFPDLDAYDWEGQAAAQLKNYDPKNQIQEYAMWNGPFLRLAHLMGFENGLCAMYEEPEACLELLDAVTDYKIKVAERAVKYFRPDAICTYDDVATELSTFMSPDKYRELIKPMHKKFNDAVRAMGVIPNTHVCGKCEAIVPDLVDEGSEAWEICQPENDLSALQAKLGGKLAFIGGFDMKGRFAYMDLTEEALRAAVRETIDTYAPGGNYAMLGMILYSDPGKFVHTMAIMSDETVKYGTNYYSRS
ncbi:uroporphyrinogen decarboxylase family protein [Sporobacter termitidis]|nr:uroporphyrinogen decarboxylase family protein [Sporobacter termitidis]